MCTLSREEQHAAGWSHTVDFHSHGQTLPGGHRHLQTLKEDRQRQASLTAEKVPPLPAPHRDTRGAAHAQKNGWGSLEDAFPKRGSVPQVSQRFQPALGDSRPAPVPRSLPSSSVSTAHCRQMQHSQAGGTKGRRSFPHSGCLIKVEGLQQAEHLNGSMGKCLELDASTGRWIVELSDGTTKAIRPENLSPPPIESSSTMFDRQADGNMPGRTSGGSAVKAKAKPGASRLASSKATASSKKQ